MAWKKGSRKKNGDSSINFFSTCHVSGFFQSAVFLFFFLSFFFGFPHFLTNGHTHSSSGCNLFFLSFPFFLVLQFSLYLALPSPCLGPPEFVWFFLVGRISVYLALPSRCLGPPGICMGFFSLHQVPFGWLLT